MLLPGALPSDGHKGMSLCFNLLSQTIGEAEHPPVGWPFGIAFLGIAPSSSPLIFLLGCLKGLFT